MISKYAQGVNIIKLDEEVAKVFPTSKSLNDALKMLIKLCLKQMCQKLHN